MYKKPMGNTTKLSLATIAILVVGAVLFAYLWRQQADLKQIKRENERLAERNRALENSLRQNSAIGTTPAPSEEQISSRQNSASAATPDAPLPNQAAVDLSEKPSETKTLSHPPDASPEPNVLALSAVSSKKDATGFTATMEFKPTTTNALADVWVVVRLPRNSGVSVLDIGPADSTQYTNTGKRVAEEGKFAIFQGRPLTVKPLKFSVSVSGPVTASVRGTCGINRFNLEISDAGAKVRGE